MVYTYKRGLSSEQDLVDGSPSRSEDMANKIECYIFGILLQLAVYDNAMISLSGKSLPEKRNRLLLNLQLYLTD